jgi:hypothetical protein
MRPSVTARFWAKVKKTDGCWHWTGATKAGYGKCYEPITLRALYAHRVSWQLQWGEIPDGYVIHHRCHNKLCVRPSHLSLETASDHVRDHADHRRCA